jgi:SulP family sulfate permease
LLNGVVSGTVMAFALIPEWIALAPLLFSQTLRPYVPVCLGMLLLGSIVTGVVVSLRKNTPYTFAHGQPSVAAPLLVMLLASITAALSTGPALLPTAVAALAVSAIVVGIFFFLLGWLRLGGVMRFIPHSVVQGFLAGVGLSLVFFAFSLASGSTVTIHDLSPLWKEGAPLRWAPAIAYGVLLFSITKRWRSPTLLPGLLIATFLLFFAAMHLIGIDSETAMARGWILGPFEQNSRLWPPLDIADLSQVEWSLLLKHSGLFALIAVVCVVDLLANSAGRETTTEHESDTDQTLRVNGAANILSGSFGGNIGFEGLAGASLSYKLRAPGRTPALTCAAITFVTMMFGGQILSTVPAFMLGGLITFTALSIIAAPLFGSRHKMPRTEYGLIWGVALVVAFFGVGTGAACGLLISLGIFVVNYSRLSVIHFSGTGAYFRSVVSRSPAAEQWLARKGNCTRILRLQGYIFFGTAHALVTQIREILNAGGTRYLILDFSRVDGIDASGLASFTRLRKLTRKAGVTLVFSALAPDVRRRLELASVGSVTDAQGADNSLRTHADLDQSLEWCENQLLRGGGAGDSPTEALALLEAEGQALIQTLVADMAPFLERAEFPAGHVLWHAGDPSREMYYVESGELQLFAGNREDTGKRVAVIAAGEIVGINGFYLREGRPATMRVTQLCVLQRLSDTAMQRMASQVPDLTTRLERYLLVVQSRLLVRSFHSVDKGT